MGFEVASLVRNVCVEGNLSSGNEGIQVKWEDTKSILLRHCFGNLVTVIRQRKLIYSLFSIMNL